VDESAWGTEIPAGEKSDLPVPMFVAVRKSIRFKNICTAK
jgi:hypothetical protein